MSGYPSRTPLRDLLIGFAVGTVLCLGVWLRAVVVR